MPPFSVCHSVRTQQGSALSWAPQRDARREEEEDLGKVWKTLLDLFASVQRLVSTSYITLQLRNGRDFQRRSEKWIRGRVFSHCLKVWEKFQSLSLKRNIVFSACSQFIYFFERGIQIWSTWTFLFAAFDHFKVFCLCWLSIHIYCHCKRLNHLHEDT